MTKPTRRCFVMAYKGQPREVILPTLATLRRWWPVVARDAGISSAGSIR